MAYTYTELDRSQNLIRLLHLSPASFDDTIRCHFTDALLDDKPDYEALSYTWGDVKDTRSIEVEGKAFSITSNLHLALKYLRLENAERTLWVDALCINQKNNNERMHQVSRMRSIYGQASLVVVWLGEGWEGSDTAMGFLRKLGEDDSLHLDPSQEPSISVDGLDLDSSKLRSHIIRLFDLPWWKRTWTVQEFILAENLVFQCSRYLISREIVLTASNNFYRHGLLCCYQFNDMRIPDETLASSVLELMESLSKAIYLGAILKARKHGSYNVLLAFSVFSTQEVTDSRDKLYGMLGLGTGEYADLVDADYTLSPEEVCEAVVIKSIERTGKLEFLSHLVEYQNPKLPSYIPNWTGSFAWKPFNSNRLERIDLFNASLNTAANWKAITRGIASSPGIVFDVVTSTSSQTGQSLFDFDLVAEFLKELHRLAGIEQSSEEEAMYGHTTDSRLLALWHALRGGVEVYTKKSNLYHRRLKDADLSKYTKWTDYVTASRQQRAELWDSELHKLRREIKIATYGRRFFNTRKGYFGFGAQKCEVGDIAVVLAGGSLPYIIRPVPSTDEFWAANKLCARTSYRMLGDSYVHGIMDGEALELGDESARKWQEIVFI
ncbi:Heterokaryon incompatibility protein 6,OR allele [Lachnellula occidentalis]|uniref:Heterokaryon incompatibility protein 6,OR allele n=1 Tax=Lachnellula occidentalis TaxID=215460 RepID=A0A8H8S241_9HELO|nr:Heterokaryon incompatibility protein 6,OR allele [Lachnellula occidentalis]